MTEPKQLKRIDILLGHTVGALSEARLVIDDLLGGTKRPPQFRPVSPNLDRVKLTKQDPDGRQAFYSPHTVHPKRRGK